MTHKGSYTVNRSDSEESCRLTSPGPGDRPDSAATDDQNVDNAVSDVSSAKSHQMNAEGDDNDILSDFLPKKLAQVSNESVEADESFTKNQILIREMYLALRLILGVFNCICLILKSPAIFLGVKIIVDVLRAKNEQSMVTTVEPPYNDEIAAPTIDESSKKRAMAIEIGALLVLYVAMLLVHFLCVFSFCLNKRVFHMFLYLPVIGIWLFLAITSYFIQYWPWTFSAIFMVFQVFIHANGMIGAQQSTELVLIRVSIWFDIVTFILSILYVVASVKLNKQLKTASLSCKPHYSILKFL